MNASLATILALGLCASSCIIEADSAPARASGALVVDWTINGLRDPEQCDQGGAESIDILVYRASGALVGEYEASCRVFAARIELPPGLFDADAVLLDEFGSERTTVVNLQTFEIFGDDELHIPIDFPASSFR